VSRQDLLEALLRRVREDPAPEVLDLSSVRAGDLVRKDRL